MAWWYPGSSKVDFVHADSPLMLPTRSGSKRAFTSLCQEVTPDICTLNPLLFNGHLQTVWTTRKIDAGPPIHYKRRVFASDSKTFKGHFAVDFVVAPRRLATQAKDDEGHFRDDIGLKEDPTGLGHTILPPRTTYFTDQEFSDLASGDTRPVLIMLHGLSGGSYETYLRQVIEPLVEQSSSDHGKSDEDVNKTSLSGGDWDVLVCNSRGCAGSKITTPMLYNARSTWDVRQVVAWSRKTWPNRPLFGIGFSIGANMLTTYLGEEGSNCPLSAACIVANPWDLEVTHKALKRTSIGRIYSRAMGESMKTLFQTHADTMTQNKSFDMDRIEQIKQLYEFDREIQCTTWGYPTETSYYRDASSTDAVLGIRVPTMALHAIDDPIACDEAVPYEEIKMTPYLVLVRTGRGGHLSWFEWSGQRWHAKPIVGFFREMVKTIDFSALEAPQMPKRGGSGMDKAPFKFSTMDRKARITMVQVLQRARSYPLSLKTRKSSYGKK